MHDVLKRKIQQRKEQHRFRVRQVIDSNQMISFASNDYLGLQGHKKISKAVIYGVKKYGVGSGGSPLVQGYTSAHQALEEAFADWLGVEKSLLFTSGYQTNIGVISAICSRSSYIVSDKLCHASILDGITLSRAKHRRFRHNDMVHLQQVCHQKQPELIIAESVYSMRGDIAAINDLVSIAKKHQSLLMVDDAHGIGVIGKAGGGVKSQFNLSANDINYLVTPLGKAFNAVGAMVSGNADDLEPLIQYAKSYGYSTSLPPAMACALLATLEVIKKEPWRRIHLHNNIRYFVEYATYKNLQLVSYDLTPIKSVLIIDDKKLCQIQQQLIDNNIFVAAIRAPTVPVNQSCLRVCLTALHTHQQIESLIDFIIRISK